MSTSTLSDRDLNEAIADAAGWRRVVKDDAYGMPSVSWHDGKMPRRYLPNYATSLDALSEPEQVLRDAGWALHVRTTWTGAFLAEWAGEAPLFSVGLAPTEARARAEAVLAALKALKEARS